MLGRKVAQQPEYQPVEQTPPRVGRFRTIVRQEHEDRIVIRTRRLQMVDQTPDLMIGRLCHPPISRHRACCGPALIGRQPVPVGGRAHHRRARFGWNQPHGDCPRLPRRAQSAPAAIISVGITRDIRVGRLHRNVIGQEIDRGEERLARSAPRIDVAQHRIDDEGRGIKGRGQGGGLAVLSPVSPVVQPGNRLLLEIVGTGIRQRIGVIISARGRQPVAGLAQMPFAGEIGAIARLVQHLGQRHHMVVEHGVITRLADMLGRDRLGHVAKPGAVVADAGLQHRPGWRTRTRDVEIGETHAVRGERVDIGGVDLAAEAANIRIAPIVRHQQDDIRPRRRRSPRGWKRHQGQRQRQPLLHRARHSSLLCEMVVVPAGRLNSIPSSPTVIGPAKWCSESPRNAG
ncbi:hypothetical protein D9M73_130450 [compost metagenome]